MSNFTFSGKDFMLDGKPFKIFSGAMHFFRIHHAYWEDRLKKLRACGFNTVETYVPWNLHEKKEGEFDFSGGLDLVHFVELAAKLGLKVIVRPGPYICAEFENGGLPSWLLSIPGLKLRCNNELYLSKVGPYYREVITRLKPYLCTVGGPIIMMQVENEYGSYGDDKEYLRRVAAMYREYGADCLLYTSDGPLFGMFSGGTLPDLPCVANFGSNPKKCFEVLEAFRPNQPLMCGEFWCGWFDHWGEDHHTRTAESVMNDLQPMLDIGASFNFYMFHGGTNFGFTNGSNFENGKIEPTVTSYDYCAPVSEAGDLTPTYFAIQKALSKLTDIPDIKVENLPKADYGKLNVTGYAPLFDNLSIGKTVKSTTPLSMEDVGQNFGYILYSSYIDGPMEERRLHLVDVHDRAIVFINGKYAGIVDRNGRNDEITASIKKGERIRLDILVENCGRINFGEKLFDRKGLLAGARFGGRFHFGWDNTSFEMDDLSGLKFTDKKPEKNTPVFIKGTFNIEGQPKDTFIRPSGLHKGFIVVNGFNIGRYWNDSAPQKTFYVPAPILKEGENEVVIFESDNCENFAITMEAVHDLG